MKLVGLVLVAAVAIGYLTGGRLSRLSALRIRFAPLAAVGLALQLAGPSAPWGFVLLVMSFICLAIFAIANLRTTGFPLILAGLLLNLVVIAVNGGMPVTREAIVAADQAANVRELADRSEAKHHLAGEDDRLLFLADAIGIAAPLRQVVSVGDVLAYAGVAVVVIAGMRTRPSEDDRGRCLGMSDGARSDGAA